MAAQGHPLIFNDGCYFYRMSLFSFFRKNKQESASGDGAFYSRAEEESRTVRSRGKRARNEKPGDDPVLPEKKRARRRLVGAVALVLAAVIGLPMLLDSEPKPLASDIAIHIPSRDKPSIDDGTREAAASVQPGEEIVDPADLAKQSAPSSRIGEQSSAAPATAAALAEQTEQTEQKPQPIVAKKAPDARPAPAPAEKPKPRVAATTDDGARALALLEGRLDPATQNQSEKYVIQVAALATKDNVDDLQARLKTAGIRSYTEPVATASGPRTRIRVGPFASRDEAEKMLTKIVKLGFNGTLMPA